MGFGLQLLSTEYPWLCFEIKKEGNPRSKKIVALCPLVGEIVEFAAIQTRQLSSLDTLGPILWLDKPNSCLPPVPCTSLVLPG